MWVIFIVSALIIGLATLGLIWVGNKLSLSIKRDNRKFEREIEKEKENKTDE